MTLFSMEQWLFFIVIAQIANTAIMVKMRNGVRKMFKALSADHVELAKMIKAEHAAISSQLKMSEIEPEIEPTNTGEEQNVSSEHHEVQ